MLARNMLARLRRLHQSAASRSSQDNVWAPRWWRRQFGAGAHDARYEFSQLDPVIRADLDRETHEVHGGGVAEFVGEFQQSRRELDYSWHTHYSPTRQLLHDRIVRSMLTPVPASARPWLVFTAGAMGSGSSSRLSAH